MAANLASVELRSPYLIKIYIRSTNDNEFIWINIKIQVMNKMQLLSSNSYEVEYFYSMKNHHVPIVVQSWSQDQQVVYHIFIFILALMWNCYFLSAIEIDHLCAALLCFYNWSALFNLNHRQYWLNNIWCT